MSYTISIRPSTGAGQIIATSSDERAFATTTPLLDGARYWRSLNAPSSAAIVTVWSSGSTHWSLRSTIGHAASLRVKEGHDYPPRFAKWTPWSHEKGR